MMDFATVQAVFDSHQAEIYRKSKTVGTHKLIFILKKTNEKEE